MSAQSSSRMCLDLLQTPMLPADLRESDGEIVPMELYQFRYGAGGYLSMSAGEQAIVRWALAFLFPGEMDDATLSDLLNVDDRCRKTLLEAVEEFRRG